MQFCAPGLTVLVVVAARSLVISCASLRPGTLLERFSHSVQCLIIFLPPYRATGIISALSSHLTHHEQRARNEFSRREAEARGARDLPHFLLGGANQPASASESESRAVKFQFYVLFKGFPVRWSGFAAAPSASCFGAFSFQFAFRFR